MGVQSTLPIHDPAFPENAQKTRVEKFAFKFKPSDWRKSKLSIECIEEHFGRLWSDAINNIMVSPNGRPRIEQNM